MSFLSDTPKVQKKIEPGKCSYYKDGGFPFEISAHPVDHSIFGATAYILRGDTTVAYTGDFRLHGKNGESTCRFVKNAKDASVLITEGTRVVRDDLPDGETSTEQSVCDVCRSTVESACGLVIADFSARNLSASNPSRILQRRQAGNLWCLQKISICFGLLLARIAPANLIL